jgi:hypothetical protein
MAIIQTDEAARESPRPPLETGMARYEGIHVNRPHQPNSAALFMSRVISIALA